MLLSRMKVKDGRLVTKDSIFAVVQSGGSVGEQAGEQYQGKKIIKKGFPTLEEAKAFASRWNAMLSPGEKQYYKIKYSAIEMKDSTKDSITEGSKIVVNTENHVNENAIAVSVNEDSCLVRFENGDEETIPIESISAFESMANDKCSKDATAFNIGDKVVSNITAQGLVKGNKYSIVDIDQNFTPFGNFVSYKVKGDGKEFWVNNGHLLLSKTNDEVSETETKINELKHNMDAARARGYDTAPYQKEIDRLRSMDALSEIDKKMLSQGKYLKVILPSGMGEDLYTNNFTAAKEMAKEYGVGTRVVNLNENKDKYTGDPLTDKGKEIMASLKEQYGEEKGEQVFYAMKNSGQIEGIDSKTTKDREFKTIAVRGPGVERETVEIAVDVSPRWGKIYRIRRIPNVPDMLIDKDTGWNSLEKLKSEALRIIRSVGY